MSAKKNQNRID